MADEMTIERPEDRLGRVSRTGRQTEQVQVDAAPSLMIEDDGANAGTSPADALEEAHRTLQQAEQQLATERAARQRAETDARTAANAAAHTQQARVGDQRTAVTQAQERAKADHEAAKSQLRMAREAGDFEAEVQASDRLSDARYRFNTATSELQRLGTGPTRTDGAPQQQQQAAPDALTDAARAWIADHPKFNSDPKYRAIAIGAHEAAKESGRTPDSPAYFQFLDETLAQFEAGANPGGRRGGEQEGGNMQNGRQSGGSQRPFGGAPPSRSGGGGAKEVQTAFGGRRLAVRQKGNGDIGISIPEADRPDWEEAARINSMSLAEYAYEQVRIAENLAAGGESSIVVGEGRTYR